MTTAVRHHQIRLSKYIIQTISREYISARRLLQVERRTNSNGFKHMMNIMHHSLSRRSSIYWRFAQRIKSQRFAPAHVEAPWSNTYVVLSVSIVAYVLFRHSSSLMINSWCNCWASLHMSCIRISELSLWSSPTYTFLIVRSVESLHLTCTKLPPKLW